MRSSARRRTRCRNASRSCSVLCSSYGRASIMADSTASRGFVTSRKLVAPGLAIASASSYHTVMLQRVLTVLIGSVLATVACSSPSPSGPSEPLDNHLREQKSADIAPTGSGDTLVRGRFVGRNIGYQLIHIGHPSVGQITLPEGLVRRSNINFADGHRVVSATEDGALIILLTDRDGVVLDDVTLPGLAQSALVADCGGDAAVLGVVDVDACPQEDAGAQATSAFEVREGRLERHDEPAECDCFLVHADRDDADDADDGPIP